MRCSREMRPLFRCLWPRLLPAFSAVIDAMKPDGQQRSSMTTAALFLLLFRLTDASCIFPWSGEWIQQERPVNISQKHLGILGECRENRGDEYLLASQTNRGECFRCLVAFPVHYNALQYKITQCVFDPSMTIEKCRRMFSGDVVLHTMFRKDAAAISCPLEMPLNFTYYDSSGTCSSRSSNAARCAQWNRLAMRYQACPENPHREAAVIEMECIAAWKSIGQNYFAARIGGKRGESYRCFILQTAGTSGLLGISADSGCQELTHIGAAATTINFRQEADVEADCEFPAYLWKHEGRKHKNEWTSIVHSVSHRVHRGTWISSYRGRNDTVWTCTQRKERSHAHFFRAHVRKGCTVGFQCIQIQRRKKHLLQIFYGPINSNEYEDCLEMTTESSDTLFLEGFKDQCSLRGRHYSPLCPSPSLTVGCDGETIRLLRECHTDDYDKFTCAAQFSEDGMKFVVMRNEETGKFQCLTQSFYPSSMLKIYDHVACDSLSVSSAYPSIAINVTHSEPCGSSILPGFLSSSSTISLHRISMFLLLYVPQFLSLC